MNSHWVPQVVLGEPAIANKPAEFCGTANHSSREKKSRRFSGCCKTNAPPATNVRSIRLWGAAVVQPSAQGPLVQPQSTQLPPTVRQQPNRRPGRDNFEKFVPPTAAGWQFRQMAEKTARKAFRPALYKPRQPDRPRRVAKSPRPKPGCAVPNPAAHATLRPVSQLFCAALPLARSPGHHWHARAHSQMSPAATRRWIPEILRTAVPPRRIPLWNTPQNKAPGTFSSPNTGTPETWDRAGFLSGSAAS